LFLVHFSSILVHSTATVHHSFFTPSQLHDTCAELDQSEIQRGTVRQNRRREKREKKRKERRKEPTEIPPGMDSVGQKHAMAANSPKHRQYTSCTLLYSIHANVPRRRAPPTRDSVRDTIGRDSSRAHWDHLVARPGRHIVKINSYKSDVSIYTCLKQICV